SPAVPPPVEVKPPATKPAKAPAAPETVTVPPKPPKLDFTWHVRLVRPGTDESHVETIQFSQEEAIGCDGDGIGASGPRGRELALRLAIERAPKDFVFANAPGAIAFDLDRLTKSLDRDR